MPVAVLLQQHLRSGSPGLAPAAVLQQHVGLVVQKVIIPTLACLMVLQVIPIFDQMLREQQEQGVHWTPSRVRAQGRARPRAQGAWLALYFPGTAGAGQAYCLA